MPMWLIGICWRRQMNKLSRVNACSLFAESEHLLRTCQKRVIVLEQVQVQLSVVRAFNSWARLDKDIRPDVLDVAVVADDIAHVPESEHIDLVPDIMRERERERDREREREGEE
jgi:hypothetical protein